MDLIETIELTSNTSSVTFSNIPTDGQELRIIGQARSNSAAFRMAIILNSNTSETYKWQETGFIAGGSGTSSDSGQDTDGWKAAIIGEGAEYNNDEFGTFTIHLPNYASSSMSKTFAAIGGKAPEVSTNFTVFANAGGYVDNIGTVTSVTLKPDPSSNAFEAETNFSLYKL